MLIIGAKGINTLVVKENELSSCSNGVESNNKFNPLSHCFLAH